MANFDLFGNEVIENSDLKDRFLIPPFSVLDGRQGYWLRRKNKWKNIIQDNGESRSLALGNKKEFNKKDKFASEGQGVSVLDPVIAEICVKWFGIDKGNIIDPFAGDTVFGYVAGFLGHCFTGIEIRQEQAEINNNRTKNFNCKYICDDGQNISKHINKDSQDLIFSCPPYFDLEVYSNLPNDASNQKEFKDFISILTNAFSSSIDCLKNNRFACIVIGDIRNDKNSFYYRLPDKIKDIFENKGMYLFNEFVLIEPVGSKAVIASKSFKNRKIMKSHQNIFVFYKGDTKEIKNNYPELIIKDEYYEGANVE